MHFIVVALNFVFNLQTGGGKSYIPPDEVLDRVASILGATCNGLTAEFGGDANEAIASEATCEAIVEVLDFQPLPELAQGSSVAVLGGNGGGNDGGGGGSNTPKNFIFNTPKSACKLHIFNFSR